MADVFFQTYQAIGRREDLLDVISNISPTDTPMLSRFGRTSAANTYHEWQKDSLGSASTTGVVEGTDYESTALTPTTRTGNYTQISRRGFRVSETQQAVNNAGRANEYAYQALKAMKTLATDMEKTIHDGTGNSGASGTARELKGVRSWISTNIDTGTGTAGVALTSGRVNGLLQTIWGQGGKPNAIYVNGFQKRQIDGFTTPLTRYADASSDTYKAVVNIYDSSFGQQAVILDRYATTSELLALQEDLWKVAILRPMKEYSLPNAGGGPKGMVEVEYTLEALNEAGSGKHTQLTTS